VALQIDTRDGVFKLQNKFPLKPSERGTHVFSVPQAGRMVGLSRNGSYAAAKRGEIPTVKFGFRLVVPRAAWLRRLGLESEAEPASSN
jgi:hypothetical protein